MLRYKKQFIYFTCLIIFLSGFFAFNVYSANLNSEYLRVNFFDVGQGDSAFIQTPGGKDILIDGGPDQKVIGKLNQALPFYDKYIDIIIISHPHEDHIAGLIDVINKYDVGVIYYNNTDYNSNVYNQLLNKIKVKNIKLMDANEVGQISLEEGVILDFIYPNSLLNIIDNENINNNSVIVKFSYKEDSFLFAGDAEDDEEQLLISEKLNLQADVLKAPHHGSTTSSLQKFLESVSPKIAIISSGTGNKFGHPSRRIIKRLERLKIKIYRTDLDGDIKIISNGDDNYKISQTK